MHPRTILSVGNFFLALFQALMGFILFPYLSTLMPVAYAGLVVASGALISLGIFPFLPRLVIRYGAQKMAFAFGVAEMISLFILAASPSVSAVVLLIIITITLQPFLSYELDLLVEATMTEMNTAGRIRTAFMTAWNIGTLIAPLLLGAILADSDIYNRVFLAAGAVLIPFIVLFSTEYISAGAPPTRTPIRDTVTCMLKNTDLAAVTFGHFLLYIFFIWAGFYVPVYLHTVLFIPWSTLGWMFTLMLLPYVLLEYPAGWIADRLLGDKEMMFAGFIFAGGALISLSVLTVPSPLVFIVAVLVISRIGAALVESTTEGHFFRRVSERDINSVSVFRGIWPLANLIGPLVGSVILFFGTYQLFFILTGGFIVIAGIISTLLIKDFR